MATATNRWSHRLRAASAVLLMAAILIPLVPGVAQALPYYGEYLNVGGAATEIEIDNMNGLAFVSVEDAKKVAVVDLATKSVAREIELAADPFGLSLSPDATRLYVALQDLGSVAEVDAATGAVIQTIDVTATLGDDRTYDVQLVGTNLFVTASPGGLGLAKVVKYDLVAESAIVVASDRFIRARPHLDWDGADALFVSEDFSPNALHRLDLTDPAAPIAAEDEHGSVDGTRSTIVAAQGTRLITGSGQELSASTIEVLGSVPAGVPASSSGGSLVFIAQVQDNDRLRVRKYSLATDRTTKTYTTTCSMANGTINDFKVVQGNKVFLASGETGLCIVDTTAELPLCDGLAPTMVGTNGDNLLIGTNGDDVILGLGGKDEIRGRGGSDHICGGDGHDVILPGEGDDRVFGGPGQDWLSYSNAPGPVHIDLLQGTAEGSGRDVVSSFSKAIGSAYADTILGDHRANVIRGGAGDDLILGRRGSDFLQGEGGDDELRGFKGRDKLWGGNGNDLLVGGPGDDVLNGQTGAEDFVSYQDAAGPVIVDLTAGTATGDGNDRVVAEGIIGSAFDDSLRGDMHENFIYGLKGDDLLFGEYFEDLLSGGLGDDELHGGDGNDTLDGWKGNDLLIGDDGDDVLLGFGGSDDLRGGPGADLLAGERGNDTYDGGAGIDAASFMLSPNGVNVDLEAGTASGEGVDTLALIEDVIGSDHADTILGDGVRNTIWAQSGNDTVAGRAGDDRLDGGAGSDFLNGGTGFDICAAGESHSSCESIIAGDVAADLPSPTVAGPLTRIRDD